MNISAEQLAELLAGIAKAQNSIIDAVERANGGWRNTHMSPMLSVAANMRSAEPRLIDLPARVLMRYQGRPAVDVALIAAELEHLIEGKPMPATSGIASAAMARPEAVLARPAAAGAAAPAQAAPVRAAPAAPASAAPVAAATPAAAAPVPARPAPVPVAATAAPAPAAAPGGDDLDFIGKT